jgi:hypothetical protein
MATDENLTPPPSTSTPKPSKTVREDMVRIFTYPKIIFIWPTFVAALICAVVMTWIGDTTQDPRKTTPPQASEFAKTEPAEKPAGSASETAERITFSVPRRFNSPQNLAALFFLGVFGINMVVMSLDFPRFTLIGGILLVIAVAALLGWLSLAFNLTLIRPLLDALEGIFVAANKTFYFIIALILAGSFLLIWLTRWLDYWEVRPNEILHHHGPLSDLERFPTTNLKFDKEIPDVMEYLILGAGRLVLRIPTEDRAFVLDNVMWIDDKEKRLKNLMSRMNVRITLDQEASEP